MPIIARPSVQPPESVKPSLVYASQRFVAGAAADVDALVTSFETAWSSASAASVSPFEVFKRQYAATGWTHAHLGVVDPALRKDWFDVLTRLFLQKVSDDAAAAPVRRAAAFFGLYCLWATQPSELGPRYTIRLDLPTYDLVQRLPLTLVAALEHAAPRDATPATPRTTVADIDIDPRILDPASLDATSPSHDGNLLAAVEASSAIRPTHDVIQIIQNLNVACAWTLLPEPVWSFPNLPTSRLVESSSTLLTKTDPLQNEESFPPTDWGNDILATRAELALWASGKGIHSQASSVWNPTSVAQAKQSYLNAKSCLDPSHSTEQKVLKSAVEMTMRVMKPAGPLMNQLLPPKEEDQSDIGAFRMVRRDNTVGEWSEAAQLLEATAVELEIPL